MLLLGRHWNVIISLGPKDGIGMLSFLWGQRTALECYHFFGAKGRYWNVIISLGPKDGIGILVSGFVRTFLLNSERAAA